MGCLPFMQRNIAVPQPLGPLAFHFLPNPPAQRIISEVDLTHFRIHRPHQHPVGRPLVVPAGSSCLELNAECLFHRWLGPGSVALRFLKLLKYQISFAIVVIIVIRVFLQPSACIIFPVGAVFAFEQIANGIGRTIDTFRPVLFLIISFHQIVESIIIKGGMLARPLVINTLQAYHL